MHVFASAPDAPPQKASFSALWEMRGAASLAAASSDNNTRAGDESSYEWLDVEGSEDLSTHALKTLPACVIGPACVTTRSGRAPILTTVKDSSVSRQS